MDDAQRRAAAGVYFDRLAPEYSPWVILRAMRLAADSGRLPSLGDLVTLCKESARAEAAAVARMEAANRPALPSPTCHSEPLSGPGEALARRIESGELRDPKAILAEVGSLLGAEGGKSKKVEWTSDTGERVGYEQKASVLAVLKRRRLARKGG